MQTNSVRFFSLFFSFLFFSFFLSICINHNHYTHAGLSLYSSWSGMTDCRPYTHTLHLCLWETYKSNCSVCPSLFLSSSLIFLHTTYTCTYSSIVLILCVHYHAWHTCFQSYLKLMSGCLSLVKLRFAEIHALLNVHKQFA